MEIVTRNREKTIVKKKSEKLIDHELLIFEKRNFNIKMLQIFIGLFKSIKDLYEYQEMWKYVPSIYFEYSKDYFNQLGTCINIR